mmetsp:Transcript_56025/g.162383  ORF Transcript_56025/g.162383 Transcript_56025/m.162383 type:complete len:286 (+) Transcript_56025:553-1410(+)
MSQQPNALEFVLKLALPLGFGLPHLLEKLVHHLDLISREAHVVIRQRIQRAFRLDDGDFPALLAGLRLRTRERRRFMSRQRRLGQRGHQLRSISRPSEPLSRQGAPQFRLGMPGLPGERGFGVAQSGLPLLLLDEGLRAAGVEVRDDEVLIAWKPGREIQCAGPNVGGFPIAALGAQSAPFLRPCYGHNPRGLRQRRMASDARHRQRAAELPPALVRRHGQVGLHRIQGFAILPQDPPIRGLARLGAPVRLSAQLAASVIVEDRGAMPRAAAAGIQPVDVAMPGA